MKAHHILLLLAFCVGITSCKLSSVSMQVLKPAPITFPDHIKKIVVLDRTRPSKENKGWNIAEGILTGEGIFADRDGANECLNGITNALVRTPRFTVTQYTGPELTGTGRGEFSIPLDWSVIEKICADNGADAVVALEAFDSDGITNHEAVPVKVKNKEGAETTVTEYHAHMRMNITNGWRAYDPKTKQIIDQFRDIDFLGFDARGSSVSVAISNLIAKREAAKQTGFHAGMTYGDRIAPTWVNLTRNYYRKENEAFLTASRKVATQDWKGAAEIWKAESASANKKIAGRACYNMALACEMEGSLDNAIIWATKAYQDYGLNRALSYTNELTKRKIDSQRLAEQMKSVE